MYGIPLTGKEVDQMEEKLGSDLIDLPDLGDCEAFHYGNLVSGDTAFFLGILESLQAGPEAHKKAKEVKFGPVDEWDKKLFDVCLKTGLVTLESGWVKKPNWYLMSSYG
jgi:hypothetical protein